MSDPFTWVIVENLLKGTLGGVKALKGSPTVVSYFLIFYIFGALGKIYYLRTYEHREYPLIFFSYDWWWPVDQMFILIGIGSLIGIMMSYAIANALIEMFLRVFGQCLNWCCGPRKRKFKRRIHNTDDIEKDPELRQAVETERMRLRVKAIAKQLDEEWENKKALNIRELDLLEQDVDESQNVALLPTDSQLKTSRKGKRKEKK